MSAATIRYVSPPYLSLQSAEESISRDVKELDKNSPHNWLDDNIWLKKAYHEWRAPLIINSNWWLALADDALVPRTVRYAARHSSRYTSWQIRRAAWLVHRILDFKGQLERSVHFYPAHGLSDRSTDRRYIQIQHVQVCLSEHAVEIGALLLTLTRSLVPPCRSPVL